MKETIKEKIEGWAFKLAVRVLRYCFKKDKESHYGYAYSWISNIAMSFYDECRNSKVKISSQKLHTISNRAARNFIDLLVGADMKKIMRKG